MERGSGGRWPHQPPDQSVFAPVPSLATMLSWQEVEDGGKLLCLPSLKVAWKIFPHRPCKLTGSHFKWLFFPQDSVHCKHELVLQRVTPWSYQLSEQIQHISPTESTGTNPGYILPSTSNHHPLLVQGNHWSEWAGCSWRPAGPPPAACDDDDLSSRSQAGSRDRVYDLSLECPEKHSNQNRRWVPSTKSWTPWLHSMKQDTKHITG